MNTVITLPRTIRFYRKIRFRSAFLIETSSLPNTREERNRYCEQLSRPVHN